MEVPRWRPGDQNMRLISRRKSGRNSSSSSFSSTQKESVRPSFNLFREFRNQFLKPLHFSKTRRQTQMTKTTQLTIQLTPRNRFSPLKLKGKVYDQVIYKIMSFRVLGGYYTAIITMYYGGSWTVCG